MTIFTNKIKSIEDEGIENVARKINSIRYERCGMPKSKKVYVPQVETALDILRRFDNSDSVRPHYIILRGRCQGGKTDTCDAVNAIMCEYELRNTMNIDTVMYVTGNNATGMFEQNTGRLSPYFEHTPNAPKFVSLKNSDLKKDIGKRGLIKNAIIYIDESHYGSMSDRNILIQWLESCGLNMKNEDDLVKRNIYIVSVSATAYREMDSDLYDSKQIVNLKVDRWDEETKTGYVGVEEFSTNGNFVEGITTPDLLRDAQIIKEYLESTPNPTCAVARVSKYFNRIKRRLEEYFKIFEFDCKKGKINYEGINEAIKNCGEYSKPVLIVIKGAYRMGDTIDPEYKSKIGVIYDVIGNVPVNPQTDSAKKKYIANVITTEQGLLGRISGYTDNEYWKNTRIWINCNVLSALRNHYVFQNIASPIKTSRDVFVEGDGDIIRIVKNEGKSPIEYNFVPGSNIKADSKNFLENKDSEYKNMLFAETRRYTKAGHQTISYFSNDHETADIRIPENVGKECYTFFYNKETKTLEVIFGWIRRGRIERRNDDNIVIETYKTSPPSGMV